MVCFSETQPKVTVISRLAKVFHKYSWRMGAKRKPNVSENFLLSEIYNLANLPENFRNMKCHHLRLVALWMPASKSQAIRLTAMSSNKLRKGNVSLFSSDLRGLRRRIVSPKVSEQCNYTLGQQSLGWNIYEASRHSRYSVQEIHKWKILIYF